MSPQELFRREKLITEGLRKVYGAEIAEAARVAFIYRHHAAAQLYIGVATGRNLYTGSQKEEALQVSALIAGEADRALATLLKVSPATLITALEFYRELAHDCWT